VGEVTQPVDAQITNSQQIHFFKDDRKEPTGANTDCVLGRQQNRKKNYIEKNFISKKILYRTKFYIEKKFISIKKVAIKKIELPKQIFGRS